MKIFVDAHVFDEDHQGARVFPPPYLIFPFAYFSNLKANFTY